MWPRHLIANDHGAYETAVKEFYDNFDLVRDANQILTGFITMAGRKKIDMAKAEFCELIDIGVDELEILYLEKGNDWAKSPDPTSKSPTSTIFMLT